MSCRFFVVSAPSFDGERFAIFRPGTVPSSEVFESCTVDGWPEARSWSRYAAELLTETEAREQLEEMGLSEDDVDDQIRRARATRAAFVRATIVKSKTRPLADFATLS